MFRAIIVGTFVVVPMECAVHMLALALHGSICLFIADRMVALFHSWR